MNKTRMSRVGEEIKKELSIVLQRGLKDPRIGFVTVTDVEVTSDLQLAKVYVSIFGSEEQRRDSLAGLQKAKGYLRTEIGRRVKLRHIPDFVFKLDESIDYGSKIETILREISTDGEKGDKQDE
ncbi:MULTISPECIES: 30S ribosome-binding factor RbfA [Brevibacillus]|jgi:ribosome-binding factor A|uniref:Ribosome-binding factor A n=1 Tax=Brevibacillus borstelensis AK1 TaxID=1300222 RepID=M8DKL9_9BACL|nr:30S ribosome-binding factor RbfA [Brevibacillus borstelensis]EMT54143.1 ribosome binding factor A [Brevibacillus borstelensis AK1]KKX53969.1 ribosome-binding factor A [Brevibacillus borstelensis cifa_chp40]MBE5397992.1 30S ribosome-binding factor RbfA [Brevibacillus borstelensis]MCC0563493.1 30S ribosome-binding factor RbfA [Brevibacillus borstelensis]MCM3470016.1 30S ribosome-binding factor RbfA [Brevibacillus borstelensis]